jgi:hypothetical protein
VDEALARPQPQQEGTAMSDSDAISGTTSSDKDNAQNHDIVEGKVDVDKPSQAEGDTQDTSSE